MKIPFPLLAPVLAAGILAQTGCERSQAQSSSSSKDLPSAPMIGAKCTLKLYGGNETSISLSSPEISGTLVADSPEWVGVKDGSTEHWIPKGHVLELKISR
ncbi:MAG: hypothetical protein JWO82_4142 [Akkermansiaceae bacterium]|nr:hypothetical protein [Akkermansiaceae bacterium]